MSKEAKGWYRRTGSLERLVNKLTPDEIEVMTLDNAKRIEMLEMVVRIQMDTIKKLEEEEELYRR